MEPEKKDEGEVPEKQPRDGATTKAMICKALGIKLSEATGKALAKATHLDLNGKDIQYMDNLHLCRHIRVLYLYDNHISAIEGLDTLSDLTHLYLQNNLLSSISGVGSLNNLQKLYLEGNRISRLTGFDGLCSLEELHVSNQHIKEPMELDEQALISISPSLTVLTIAGNSIKDPSPLRVLSRLTTLDLAKNAISDLLSVCQLLEQLGQLRSVDFTGNPVCSEKKYKESVLVASSDNLTMIDKKEVNALQRRSLISLHSKKAAARPGRKSGTSTPTGDKEPILTQPSSLSQPPASQHRHPAKLIASKNVGVPSHRQTQPGTEQSAPGGDVAMAIEGRRNSIHNKPVQKTDSS